MGDGEYLVPDGSAKSEIVIKKSKFIAEAVGISSAEEARELIRQKRDEHSGASHVVYAFISGGLRSELSGMSDDGEPPGTAGKPVMEVLKGRGIYNLLITVVRYFGGTKLGTGGLVRAYSVSARKALEGLPVKEHVSKEGFSLEVPYDMHEKIKLIIGHFGGSIENEEFSSRVILLGSIPYSQWESCNVELKNISRGEISLESE